MLRFLIGIALAFAAPAALAQKPQAQQQQQGPPDASPGLWTQADGRITFATARISLPTSAGAVTFSRAVEFTHAGEGLDSALQYRSADGAVFATVYVYYPGLPHAGLAGYMTDYVLHLRAPGIRPLGTRTIAAGGRADAAIRADYAAYLDNLASSAAYIKAGRWIVKLRVSGPEARRAEVEAAMTALLAGLRFDGDIQPAPAAPFEVGDCQGPRPGPARMIEVRGEDLLAQALLATFDAAGETARDERGHHLDPVLARTGTRWCLSTTARIGQSSYPILRAPPGAASDGLGGRTVLIVPMTDAGRTLELVETREPHRFTLLHHSVGATDILGSYDGVPSDDQLAAILSGADEPGTRIRASVQHHADGNTNIDVPTPTPPTPSGPTT
jgi:hypothetical protein